MQTCRHTYFVNEVVLRRIFILLQNFYVINNHRNTNRWNHSKYVTNQLQAATENKCLPVAFCKTSPQVDRISTRNLVEWYFWVNNTQMNDAFHSKSYLINLPYYYMPVLHSANPDSEQQLSQTEEVLQNVQIAMKCHSLGATLESTSKTIPSNTSSRRDTYKRTYHLGLLRKMRTMFHFFCFSAKKIQH